MNLFHLLGPALKRQASWLLAGSVLMLVSLAAAVLLLGLSGWFITAGALAGLGILAGLDIFAPGAGIRVAAITRTLARYGERLATHQATFRLLAELRLKLFERLLGLDEIQLRRLRRGDTLNRLTADIDILDHLFSGVLAPVAAALVLSLGVAAVFSLMGANTASLTVLAVAVVSLMAVMVVARLGRDRSHRVGQLEPDLRMLVTEGLEGLETLRAFDQTDWQRQRIGRCSDRIIGLHQSLARLDALGQGLIGLIGLAGVWTVLVVALWLHHGGLLSGPVAVLMVFAMLGLTEGWQPLPSAWRRLARCRVAAERVFALAQQQPLLPKPGQPLPLPTDNRLELEEVTFGYHPQMPPVMERLNLQIDAGERIALTGPSGGGKTTLALLLMRQIDPDAGRVLLGGCDLRWLDPAALRQRIGYLPQRPVVFRDTLAANLQLGCRDAGRLRMVKVLELAGLGTFLQYLPDHLDTWLDEAGANVSAGELRRIALARLMLADPGVVILDEPTTGLDRASAAAIAEGLDRWLGNRTVIMIAHDPLELPSYDRLISIDHDTNAQ